MHSPWVSRVLSELGHDVIVAHARNELRRDGWRCQLCGTITNLEVHHQLFRSRSGCDAEENLITVCAACHEGIHH